MPVIEFMGLPRSGKTTTAEHLQKTTPNLTYYPERHDLVPENVRNKDFEKNLWYAKYCVKMLNKAVKLPGVHLFERGVVDRIAIGKAYYEMGWFTNTQLNEYLSLLEKHISKVDTIVIFMIAPEDSVERAKKQKRDVSQALPYYESLFWQYFDIRRNYKNTYITPIGYSNNELNSLVEKIVQKCVTECAAKI